MLRTCDKGHQFHKISDCSVCPICEAKNKSENNVSSSLSAPARRALKKEGIDSLQKLSNYSEKEILQFHGIGKTTIPKLTVLLKILDLKFNRSI